MLKKPCVKLIAHISSYKTCKCMSRRSPLIIQRTYDTGAPPSLALGRLHVCVSTDVFNPLGWQVEYFRAQLTGERRVQLLLVLWITIVGGEDDLWLDGHFRVKHFALWHLLTVLAPVQWLLLYHYYIIILAACLRSSDTCRAGRNN